MSFVSPEEAKEDGETAVKEGESKGGQQDGDYGLEGKRLGSCSLRTA